MKNFNQDYRSSGPRNGGGERRGGFSRGGSSSGPREMFDATCSKCGKDCRVPFKPTGFKPVFCSDCYEKTDGRDGNDRYSGGGDRKPFGRREFSRAGGSTFKKADGAGGNGAGKEIKELREQVKSMNAKLDKILHALGASNAEKAPKSAEPQTEIAAATKSDKPKKAKKAKAAEITQAAADLPTEAVSG